MNSANPAHSDRSEDATVGSPDTTKPQLLTFHPRPPPPPSPRTPPHPPPFPEHHLQSFGCVPGKLLPRERSKGTVIQLNRTRVATNFRRTLVLNDARN